MSAPDVQTRTSQELAHTIKEESASTSQENSKPYEPYIPDGGLQAWLVIVGAFLISISTHGYLVSWGTFQQYYELNMLPNYTPSNIAWIGSIQYSLTFMPGLPAGRLTDLGYFRSTLFLSCIVLTVANFLIAECTKYWHFVLVQGVLIGFPIGCLYSSCIAVVSHWFKVRRPLAFAIVATGPCLGGIIYPIIFRNMVPSVGFKWTVRTIAFINFTTFVVACATIRPRLERPKTLPRMFDRKAFSSLSYCTYLFASLVAWLGLYTPFTYVSLSGVAIGMKPDFAFYMVAITNAASAVGRISSGFMAIRFGPMNVMITSMTFAAAFTYAWPYATNHGVFIFVVVMYGVTSGSFLSLWPAPVAHLGDVHDVGRRVGLQMTVMAFGALGGPPASGAIESLHHSFHQVGIFAGSMIIGSVILMIIARFFVLKRWYGGKL